MDVFADLFEVAVEVLAETAVAVPVAVELGGTDSQFVCFGNESTL